MLLKALFSMVGFLLDIIFALLPDIPQFPQSMLEVVESIFTWIEVPLGVLRYLVGDIGAHMISLVVFLWIFERIYLLLVWILKKIPVFGIE